MTELTKLPNSAAVDAAEAAVKAIPPLFPLSTSVAVNPFLGQAADSLAETAARLERVGGIRVTMKREWFADKIARDTITDDDLVAALAQAPEASRPDSLVALKKAATEETVAPVKVPDVADLAAAATGTDWPAVIAERIGIWAAGFFDEGQALWAAPTSGGVYATWREAAIHDLTPEILGLEGFARHVAATPQNAHEAIAQIAHRLGLGQEAMESYFHALLTSLGGWAQLARYRGWEAELVGKTDHTAIELLAIRLVWEDAIYGHAEEAIADHWAKSVEAHGKPVSADDNHIIDAILQEANERAAQRTLMALLRGDGTPKPANDDRPALQAAFCIDVRSEVFRRSLETVDPSIQTLGFAGFFGVATAHRRFASDVVEKRLPVLLNPDVHTHSGTDRDAEEDQSARYLARAKRAWGRFKLAAVSSFAFVEAMGPVYLTRLVRDGLNLKGKSYPDDPAPTFDTPLTLEQRIDAANTVLRAMSLTEGFARLVVIAGHGANVVNNPHESALHCGACGGFSGEVNARLLAGLLNDADVRKGLVEKGLSVPEDTLFVAALHDTTTDRIHLYVADKPSGAHAADVAHARDWFAAAGKLSRTERALRLPRADDGGDLPRRSRDWAETRPEWALAGCQAFIAAPRSRTMGRDLAGRAFLHDYAWREDEGFGILELIMTAPVVVASWISLQYYGSTVAPETFGSGNKLVHNVTGGVGVVEGNGGLMRAGLPLQSVNDGDTLVHEPLRLAVMIEAPREAMSDILDKHPGVRALFDNRWLHLFALNDTGQVAWRYAGDLEWTAVEEADPPEEKARKAS
ncbi:MAG: DUF2309 domain-containing protein [Devosia sp.]